MNIADNINFGVELEFILPSDVHYEKAKHGILKTIAEAGFPLVDYWGNRPKNPWRLDSDESIEALPDDKAGKQNSWLHGFEIQSPVLSGKDGLLSVEAMFTTLAKLGAYANSTCGLHVHVSPKRENPALFTETEIRNFVAAAVNPRQQRDYYDLIDPSRHDDNWYCAMYLSTYEGLEPDDIFDASFEQILGYQRDCKITLARMNPLSLNYDPYLQTIEFRGKEAKGFNVNHGKEHSAHIGTMVNFTAAAIRSPHANFREAARDVVSPTGNTEIYQSMRHTKPALLAARL